MIAFCATRVSDFEERLFVMDDDGSHLHCLTDDRPSGSVQDPIWSPDATQLLFSAHEDYQKNYYLINTDGSNLRHLHLPKHNGHPFLIRSWLADQKLLLELIETHTPESTTPVAFYTMRVDGSELHYLASTESFSGQTLNARAKLIPKPKPDYSLYLTATDGASERPLTERGRVLRMSHGSTPTWSATGEQVAFVVNNDSDEQLYVVNADGSDLRRLSSIAFESPVIWSPDSRYLAYVVLEDNEYYLFIADVQAHYAQRLTTIEIGSAHGPRHALFSWTADSQAVVYVHAPEEEENQLIYRVHLHNEEEELLVDNELEFQMIFDLVCSSV